MDGESGSRGSGCAVDCLSMVGVRKKETVLPFLPGFLCPNGAPAFQLSTSHDSRAQHAHVAGTGNSPSLVVPPITSPF